MTQQYPFSAILLAGGIGQRMGSTTPKQYLDLCGQPIVLYSVEAFLSCKQLQQLVVVCEEEYRSQFPVKDPRISFALPGKRRQDSVFSGLQKIKDDANLICIHDGARPFVTCEMIDRTVAAAQEKGAACTATPVNYTVKQSRDGATVEATLNREQLWEIQTPQALRRELLKRGFAYANKNQMDVTDDVALAELLNEPVTMVPGDRSNLKVTLPEDREIAHALMSRRNEQSIPL